MTEQAAKVVKNKRNKLVTGKLKKTIKHVLCRPDREFWPAISELQSTELANLIRRHKVELPELKKLPWCVIKKMPKEQRPKQKRSLDVRGFIFGLSQCMRSLAKGKCTSIIIDSGVSPRIVVSHIIESALQNKTPVVCMADLKKITTLYFGFPSCCIAFDKSEIVDEISKKVSEYWNVLYREHDANGVICIDKTELMEVEEYRTCSEEVKPFQYLTRTSKKYRAFIPPESNETYSMGETLCSQNIIKFKPEGDHYGNSGYKALVVKKFANNPNRKKGKQ